MSEYSLLLPFATDDPLFAHGFEMGRLWTLLREVLSDHDEYECHCHVENAEMALRIAEATSRTVRSEELGDGWLSLAFGPVSEDSNVDSTQEKGSPVAPVSAVANLGKAGSGTP